MLENFEQENMFEFISVGFSHEDLKSFDSEDQFTSLCIEVFREVYSVTKFLIEESLFNEKREYKKWSRDEAIIGGLMVRFYKLQLGYLDLICQNKWELASILGRCLNETIINIKYLIDKQNPKVFEEFIEYSLRTEKQLLNFIEENIIKRGFELPIETRMKSSINRSLKLSSFTWNKVNEKNRQAWSETIYNRAKSIGKEDYYKTNFALPSHYIHGNWQDLIFNHLIFEEGEFSPDFNWKHSRPQVLIGPLILCSETNKQFLENVINKHPDKQKLEMIIEDTFNKIYLIDQYYENFIRLLKQQKRNNNI